MWPVRRRGVETILTPRKIPDFDDSTGIAMRVDTEKICALSRIEQRLRGRLLYCYRESIPDRKPYRPYTDSFDHIYHNRPYDIYTLADLDKKKSYGRVIAEADQQDAMELHWIDHAICLRDSI